jgi:hypothetical protein
MAYIMVDVESDNAKGNAEALLRMKQEYGLKIRF